MAAHGGPPAMPPLELNDEERAVLRECRVNSVYFRGLPLGTVSVLIMREVIKSGRVPHIKRFSGFYYPGIFALGFLSGIASYRKKCMEKIMRLENSQLADQVRSFYKKAGMNDQIIGEPSSEDYHSQPEAVFYDQSKAYPSRDDVNVDRSFTMSSPLGLQDDDTKQTGKYTSYEELRRRNRNQWMTVGQRQPVNDQRPQDVKEEPTRLTDSDDYHSASDTYQSDMSSSIWSEGSEQSDNSNAHKGQRRSRTGPAPMKNAYGDVLEK